MPEPSPLPPDDVPGTAGQEAAGIAASGGLPIRELSRQIAVPPATVRAWERRYRVVAPSRTPGGHRRYGPADRRLLLAMRDEIVRGRRPGEAAAAVRAMGAAEPSSEPRLSRFVQLALIPDGDGIRTLLDGLAGELGAERTIVTVAIPGMREVGFHWRMGTDGDELEQEATAATRRWLSNVRAHARASRRETLLLIAGPSDRHTMGVEAFATIVALRGLPVRISPPPPGPREAAALLESARPAAVVVVVHVRSARRPAVDLLKTLDGLGPGQLFYAGGAFVATSARRRVPGEYLGEDLSAAADHIDLRLRP